MDTESEMQRLRFTHWKEPKGKKRLFLVVDIPTPTFNSVVLLEVKEYAPEEERTFQTVSYPDWVIFISTNTIIKILPKS